MVDQCHWHVGHDYTHKHERPCCILVVHLIYSKALKIVTAPMDVITDI
jgi:hypothetical protein